MCGIVGQFCPPSQFKKLKIEKKINKSLELLRHRGPDACGTFFSSEHGIAFGHTRLSILDLSETANQPMFFSDPLTVITFNGEIYNFRELREELKKEGVSFKTKGDTEVLLMGYRQWGLETLLKKCVGMFSFSLYDGYSKRLFLVRDRAGKKPLFYHQKDGILSFSSEIKGIFSLIDHKPTIDPVGLDTFLTLKYVPSPDTLLEGVKKVLPGGYLEVNSHGDVSEKIYWRPAFSSHFKTTESDLISHTEHLFDTAVQRRLVSDVPICVFLSGGIDSSLMAAKLFQGGAKDLTCYTVGYRDIESCNEFEYARKVIHQYPMNYQEVFLNSKQVIDKLQDDEFILDEPISDWVWVPLYFLSQRARQDGFKVVLVGEGSDEVFFGYDFMKKGFYELQKWQNPFYQKMAQFAYWALGPVYHHVHRGHRRYDLWRRVSEGMPPYMGSSVGFGQTQRHQVGGLSLLNKNVSPVSDVFIRQLHNEYNQKAIDPQDFVTRISYIEFFTKMGEILLQRVDRITMQNSLEARCPFLDQDLVEWAFSLPGKEKFKNGELKSLLKKIARAYLPQDIIDRKKMGFSFPFKEWLRGPLGPVVEESFSKGRIFKDGWVSQKFSQTLLKEHRHGRIDHAPRLWSLYSLSRWYDRWMA